MTPQPSGRLTAVGEGRYDLVVKRNFEATGDGVRSSYGALSASLSAARGGSGFDIPSRT